MEHSEAADTMASARYLLGEMTEEEREAFEEHFFGCSECAGEVRDGSAMKDSIRAERAQRRDRLKPVLTLLSAAAVVAVVILGIQNARLRSETEAPRVLRAYSLLTMATRGAAQTTVADGSKPLALFIDIPPQPSYPNYRIEIRDTSNRTKVALPVTADEARETVTVYVPPHRLKPGNYNVVIVGGGSTPVSTAPLEVR